MLRKLISSLLAGLTLIGLVGCGEAPVDVNEVKVTYQEINEITDKDLEKSDLFFNAQQENIQCKMEFEYTTEEQRSPEFKEYSTMSKSDIEAMDKDQLKEASITLNKVLEMGTNEDREVYEVKYSSITRQNMIDLYSSLIEGMQEAHNIVNELDQYKMHPEEMIETYVGFTTVYNTLSEMDAQYIDVANTMNQFNEVFIFEDEMANDFNALQKAFHDFAVQYPNEEYPRTVDSVQLQKARNEINRIWEKNMMTDVRKLEGVAAPTK